MSYQKEVTIANTLKKIEHREIVLPAIQREFVWQPEQIYTLFDSLMHGYPFGTFLCWKVKRENTKLYQFYDFVLNYHERDNPHCPKIGQITDRDIICVLDGQQRLTALNIGLRGSLAKKTPYKHWSNSEAFTKRLLYLDLSWSPTEEDRVNKYYHFEFLSEDQSKKKTGCWFPVHKILTFENGGPAIIEWLVSSDIGDQSIDVLFKPLYQLFEGIRIRPTVAYYEEKSQELEKVLQIFIRTNSGGKHLSYSDLLLSIVVAQWDTDAREEVHSLVDELNRIGSGFSLSKDWVLKAGLMLCDISSVGFKVQNFNRENMRILEEKWHTIKEILILTVGLVSDFGFCGKTLKADSALLPIAYIFSQGKRKQVILLERTLRMTEKYSKVAYCKFSQALWDLGKWIGYITFCTSTKHSEHSPCLSIGSN